jgi:three-Cys-motif partner protein
MSALQLIQHMANSGDHFDEFEAHTRLKHLILRTYLQAWARKMLLRVGADDRVIVIDACAGSGRDEAGNVGSPVIAAQEAAMAAAQVSKMRGRPAIVETVAIEKDSKRFSSLRQYLKPFGSNAKVLRGELIDHLPSLLAEAGNTPILCFIDPFGVEPLRAEIVESILQRPQCEVLILFHDQACLRHFGAAASAAAAELPGELDLFAGMQQASRPLSAAEARSSAARTITAERAEVILDGAFGTLNWRARIAAASAGGRRAAFLQLYEELLTSSGAAHVLSIPMRNHANQHVYHLIHGSRSVHGYAAMKEAVSSALNKTDLSIPATSTMRFAISSNLRRIADEILLVFEGKTVPWTSVGEGGFGPLRDYVLEKTAAYPHELKELQGLLKPYRNSGQKIVFTFPAIGAD